jgi:hypothetical protein
MSNVPTAINQQHITCFIMDFLDIFKTAAGFSTLYHQQHQQTNIQQASHNGMVCSTSQFIINM